MLLGWPDSDRGHRPDPDKTDGGLRNCPFDAWMQSDPDKTDGRLRNCPFDAVASGSERKRRECSRSGVPVVADMSPEGEAGPS